MPRDPSCGLTSAGQGSGLPEAAGNWGYWLPCADPHKQLQLQGRLNGSELDRVNVRSKSPRPGRVCWKPDFWAYLQS